MRKCADQVDERSVKRAKEDLQKKEAKRAKDAKDESRMCKR